VTTVARRGYRFVAPVEKVDPPDKLPQLPSAPSDSVEVFSGRSDRVSAGARNPFPNGRNRSRLLFALASVAGILAALVASKMRSVPHPKARFDQMHVRRLTSTGETVAAAISPDARYVVSAVAVDGKQSLWLRQTAMPSAVEILPPEEVVYFGLAFSHNGDLIYCSRYDKHQPAEGALYELGSLGGHFRKLLSGIAGPVSVSPDGARLAFVQWNLVAGETYVMLSHADGTHEQRLATRKLHRGFREAAAWSPDGTMLAVGITENQLRHSVMLLPVSSGRERLMTNQEWTSVKQLAWMPDGKSLLVVAADPGSLDKQLWRIAYPDGDVHRVTNDFSDYDGVSLTADGESLVTVARAAPSSIWVTASRDPGTARKLVAEWAITTGCWDSLGCRTGAFSIHQRRAAA
jgi:WD40 repeat protein